MVCIHEHALARLEITYMKKTSAVFVLANDKHIRSTEAGGSNVTVIDTLLHKGKGFTAVFPHLLNNRNDEFCIYICDLLNFLSVELLGLRTLYALMQIFADLVLTDLMGECTFFGIDGAFVRKVLLQANGRRTVQPLLGT